MAAGAVWRTYLVGHRELTRDLDTERIHVPDKGRKGRLFSKAFRRAICELTLEDRSDSIWQLKQVADENGVAMSLQRHNGVFTLTVVTRDRPNLFAALAGRSPRSG